MSNDPLLFAYNACSFAVCEVFASDLKVRIRTTTADERAAA